MTTNTLIVTGSRTLYELTNLKNMTVEPGAWALANTKRKIDEVIGKEPIDRIYTDGNRGIGYAAMRYAEEHGIEVCRFTPDWDSDPLGAGKVNTELMVAKAMEWSRGRKAVKAQRAKKATKTREAIPAVKAVPARPPTKLMAIILWDTESTGTHYMLKTLFAYDVDYRLFIRPMKAAEMGNIQSTKKSA
jgi:hypothetical protein